MKKIYLALSVLLSLSVVKAQVNNITTAPSASLANGTTGLRAPNGTSSHTSLRACYFVPASEIAATLNGTISSFGFVFSNTVCSAPANGTITVFLQNTAATSFTGTTSWSTNTVGMTQCFQGVYNLPTGSGPATVDFQFPSNFAYTGGGLNVAYEYEGGQFAPTNGFAVYTAYTSSPTICGATNTNSVLPAANTLSTTTFRPLFRFGTPNSYTNEASVLLINAPGKVSQQTGLSHNISVNVFNGSNITKTNIPVSLSILGTNPASSTVTIASLAAGATTNVVFPTYNPSALGISQINISIPNDQINGNNSASFTQSVTCDVIATGPASFAPVSYSAGVGFNTGSGVIYSKFTTATNQTLIAAEIAISSDASNLGNSVYAVVCNSVGAVLATSQTLTIGTGDLDKFYTFNLGPIGFVGGALYHVGLAQIPATPGYFPLGATYAPNATTLYVTQALSGGVLNPLNTNLGYFGIEPMFLSPCHGVGIVEADNDKEINMVLQPNPANTHVTVHVNNVDASLKLEIRNMLGQVIMQKQHVDEMNSIDLSGLKSGVYFVSLTKDKKKITQKLIIE